ncbi:hypothetical protein [Streptomyces sp. NPDC007883]|uniref:hypothetical protein n=1 Tax=Streptomyces sp. NPDC007883 TaxID=3155116 RepID=UPI0033F53AE0
MAARGTDGMTDMTVPGAEEASAVTAIGVGDGADPVGGATGPAVHGGATDPADERERTAPAVRGRATDPAGDARQTGPAAEGRETDPAGDARQTDPTTAGGRETGPSADARQTGPAPDAADPTRAASGVRRGPVTGAVRAIRRLGARTVAAARHGRAVAALLASATVVTTALSLWLGFLVHEQHADEQRRQDILAAARRSALNFTSLDYRHYERDSANVLKGAAGEFKEQFAAQTAELTKLVAANKSVSEGQVLEAGIARSDERTARVLVVADSKVTNSAAPEGQSRTYRLQLDLVLEGGRWLTSNVEFVG